MPAIPFYEQLDARLSPEELEAVARAGSFARGIIAPFAAQAAPGTTLPRDIVRQWAALGMTGLQTPRSMGGMGASYHAKIRAAQAIARHSFACAFSLNNIQGFVTRVAQYGTDAQRNRYLPGLLSGDVVGAFALTEPGAGSDLAAIATTARRADGGWLINGEKAWVTNSQLVDVILVLASTHTGARGMAGFLVDMSSQGVARLPPHKTSVGTVLGAGRVMLQDCFVRDENVLHVPGEAFRVAMKAIVSARVHVAAMCVAMLEAGLARAVSYCSKRHAFGQPLLAHQGLRWQLADVATELEAALQLVVRGADLVEGDRDATLIAAHAKKFCVHAAQRGLEACVQAMGAQGVLDEHGLMRQLAEVKLAAYADGTTEMQTERIGQLLPQRYVPGEWHFFT